MIKIDLTRVGKIYQISHSLNSFLNKSFTIIQTYGIPLDIAHQCTRVEQIEKILEIEKHKDIVVVSISTLCITEELISILRIQNCMGRNVYLFSFSKYKSWYCDHIIP